MTYQEWSVVAFEQPTAAKWNILGENDDFFNTQIESLWADLLPVGAEIMWPTNTPPAGFLLEDASAVSRTTYDDLFGVIGTTYGAGDGSTTFNVPNKKGKVVVGRDAAQTEFDTLAETGGAKTHTLTEAELAVHTHTQNAHNHTVPTGASGSTRATGGDNAFLGGTNTGNATATNQNAGSGNAHNNLQPYIVQNYIIRY